MTDDTTTLVTEITRLSLEPGDTLVLRCDDYLDEDESAVITRDAKAALPEGTPVMVLSGGLRLDGIVSPA